MTSNTNHEQDSTVATEPSVLRIEGHTVYTQRGVEEAFQKFRQEWEQYRKATDGYWRTLYRHLNRILGLPEGATGEDAFKTILALQERLQKAEGSLQAYQCRGDSRWISHSKLCEVMGCSEDTTAETLLTALAQMKQDASLGRAIRARMRELEPISRKLQGEKRTELDTHLYAFGD